MLKTNAISVLKSFPGLRAIHRALTPQPIELTPAMEGSYHHYGYLIFDPGIPMDLIDQAAADMMNRPGMSGATHHGTRWFDGWRESDPIRKIALAPKVLRLLSQVYDRKPCPFQTLNFPIGTEQKVHSDWIHFACDPPGYMCGVWVAFEDIDLGNGALVYYPGSHKLPFVTMDDVYPNGGPEKYHLYEEHMERLVREKNLIPERAILKKGEALLWAANLLHGGGSHPDKTRTRMSQVTHYFFEGCQYYSPLSSAGGYRHIKKKDWIR
jgi:Phytanoyl-CoA dioxygenase (PhyH)